MALSAANVRVGVTGAIYTDTADPATPTAPPTDAKTSLATGFVDLGYCSEDGVTETRDRSTDSIKAWQHADIVREMVTEAKLSYQFTLIETKKEVLEMYYGATVDPEGKILIQPGAQAPARPMVIDVIDGDKFIRTYLPSAQLTEVGDQVYASGEAIGYECTITAYPSDKLKNAKGESCTAAKWYSELDTTP